MITSRDIVRISGAIGKTVRDAVILPGSQLGTTIYNAGLPPERKITFIDEISKSRLSTAMFVQPLAWPVEAVGTLASIAAVTVSDSIQSGAGFFVTLHNAGLPDNEKIQGEDKRHWLRILGLQAWPGIAFGVVAGGMEVFVYDCARSGAGTFVYAYNFKMPQDQKITCINDIEQDPRNIIRKFVGTPGIVLGMVASVLGITAADSVQSGVNAFVSLYNLGLPDDQTITKVSDLENNSRPGFRKFGPQAWAGIGLGGLASLPVIAVSDSLKSGASICASIINAGLSDAAKITSFPNLVDDKRNIVRKGGIQAWPGLAGGVLIGSAAVSIVDSACSGASTFVSVYNLGLVDTDGSKINLIHGILESSRNPYRKFGPQAWFGIGVGAFLGAFTVGVIDTFRTGFATFASIYNTGLPENQRFNMTELQNDSRHIVRKISPHNALGYAAGFITGAPLAIFADSFKSGGGIFTSAYNYGLSEDKKITRMNEIKDDARAWYRIIGPQAWIGIVIGSVSGVLVAAFGDSCRTGGHTFQTMYNYGLPEDMTINWMGDSENDSSIWLRKSGPQTYPGYLFGGIGAILALTVTDSLRSFRSAFASTLNFGLAERNKIKWMHNLDSDPRAYWKKLYPLAWPGIIPAVIAGCVLDTIFDSIRASFRTATSIYNLGMDDNHKITCMNELQNDDRAWYRAYNIQTWPGIMMGLPLGLLFATVADSFRSCFALATTMFNAGLPEPQKSPLTEIQNDTREWWRIVGPQAAPGLVGGLVMGTLGAIIIDSIRSGFGVFAAIMNTGASDDMRLNNIIEIQNDTRHWFRVLGPQAWIGLLAGTFSGLAGTIGVDNVMSARGLYATIANTTLTDKITAYPEITVDQRHWLRKYGPHAGLGLIGGALGGCLTVLAIKSGQFAVNTAESYMHLSGSILNVATERPYFLGLSQARPSEEDTLSQSIAKGTGYGLAVFTTGLVGSVIYLARKVPDALLLTTALLCSPITSIIKGISYLINSQPRFPDNLDTNQLIEDNFKNIYSSLDAMGRLRTGSEISQGNGNENAWTIFRKCLTFNSKTPTEVTLDALLNAFRANHEKGSLFFSDPIYNQTIDEVKNEYKRDWFLSQKQIDLTCQEVQDVADFVLEYMGEAKVNVVANNFYSRRETTWNTLFFGSKPEVKQQVPNNKPVSDELRVEDVTDEAEGGRKLAI